MNLLPIQAYHKVESYLQTLNVNYLFVRFIVEKKVDGKIYVNDTQEPTSFYVVHPYSMSFLFGSTENEAFNNWLSNYLLNTDGCRTRYEWLQAPEIKWQQYLSQHFGDRFVSVEENRGAVTNQIEITTRVNFRFNREKYQTIISQISSNKTVVRTQPAHYDGISGNVIPANFWNTSSDFFSSGVGFTSLVDTEVASTAFSSFIFDGILEIGIETASSHKGQGHAFAACSALIDYCLENNYEPVWSCKKDNIGSYRLACRLGFEPTITLPFYRLNY